MHCKFPATHPEFPRVEGRSLDCAARRAEARLMAAAVSVWVRDWTPNLYPGAFSVKKNIRGILVPYHQRAAICRCPKSRAARTADQRATFLKATPPFITKTTLRTAVMSCKGFPWMAMMSAAKPGPRVPS